MRITINNQEFETNPSGINTNIIFKGTVHDGTGRVVDVYGFNEEEIVKLANEVKALDKNYNTFIFMVRKIYGLIELMLELNF